MSVADPTTLTLIRGSTALVKINQDKFASTYRFNDATSKVEMNIRHSTRTSEGVIYDRHNIEIVETIYATSTVPQLVRKVYLVNDQPSSDTSIVNITGLLTGLTASSNALLTKLMNWES